MKVLAIIGAAGASFLVLFFWCACIVAGRDDERSGHK